MAKYGLVIAGTFTCLASFLIIEGMLGFIIGGLLITLGFSFTEDVTGHDSEFTIIPLSIYITIIVIIAAVLIPLLNLENIETKISCSGKEINESKCISLCSQTDKELAKALCKNSQMVCRCT